MDERHAARSWRVRDWSSNWAWSPPWRKRYEEEDYSYSCEDQRDWNRWDTAWRSSFDEEKESWWHDRLPEKDQWWQKLTESWWQQDDSWHQDEGAWTEYSDWWPNERAWSWSSSPSWNWSLSALRSWHRDDCHSTWHEEDTGLWKDHDRWCHASRWREDNDPWRRETESWWQQDYSMWHPRYNRWPSCCDSEYHGSSSSWSSCQPKKKGRNENCQKEPRGRSKSRDTRSSHDNQPRGRSKSRDTRSCAKPPSCNTQQVKRKKHYEDWTEEWKAICEENPGWLAMSPIVQRPYCMLCDRMADSSHLVSSRCRRHQRWHSLTAGPLLLKYLMEAHGQAPTDSLYAESRGIDGLLFPHLRSTSATPTGASLASTTSSSPSSTLDSAHQLLSGVPVPSIAGSSLQCLNPKCSFLAHTAPLPEFEGYCCHSCKWHFENNVKNKHGERCERRMRHSCHHPLLRQHMQPPAPAWPPPPLPPQPDKLGQDIRGGWYPEVTCLLAEEVQDSGNGESARAVTEDVVMEDLSQQQQQQQPQKLPPDFVDLRAFKASSTLKGTAAAPNGGAATRTVTSGLISGRWRSHGNACARSKSTPHEARLDPEILDSPRQRQHYYVCV